MSGRAYAVKTNLTQSQLNNLRRTYQDTGFRLIDFESFATAAGQRHGGVWVENEVTRTRWAKKRSVDKLLAQYQKNSNVPGISVAINHNGRTVYRRGFGMADMARGRVAHGDTVYLAASISKAIGATMAVLLESEGKLTDGKPVNLDLSIATRAYLNPATLGPSPLTVPMNHSHAIDQLLSHTACVHHYGHGPTPPAKYYKRNLSAAGTIWYSPLLANCTVGDTTDNYSTHAFTLVGAVLELATERPVSRLLREEIANRFDLNMRAMYEFDTLPYNYERAVAYDDNRNAVKYEENSWKTLGGGIETTATALAEFGQMLLNGTILNANARDNRLWNSIKVGNRFALGWHLGNDAFGRFVEHGGRARGARSHVRIYRESNLVIAVMSNQGTHTPRLLVDSIAQEVLR